MILSNNIAIRAATTEDAQSLSALAIHVWLNTYATDGVRRDLAEEVLTAHSVDVFLSQISSSQHEKIYIAEIDNALLGFVDITSDTASPGLGMASGLEINTLYVQPEFHKKGIGKALLQRAEQKTLNLNVPLLWLTAWSGNVNAIDFYKHCGYDDVGCVDYRIADNVYENRVLVKHLTMVE